MVTHNWTSSPTPTAWCGWPPAASKASPSSALRGPSRPSRPRARRAAGHPTRPSTRRPGGPAMTKVYINGKLFDKADAKVSVYDHGLLYGDGVFEGIRVYAGKVFRLREHIDRLYETRQAHRPGNPADAGPDDARPSCDTVQANDKTGRLHPPGRHARRRHASASTRARRPTRRSSSSSMTSACTRRSCTRTAWRSSPPRRSATTPTPLNPRIKSLNYLNNILAKIEAIRAGCLEAHHAQPQRRGGRMHRRQHLPRQDAACCRRRPPTPASSKASRANAVIELAASRRHPGRRRRR